MSNFKLGNKTISHFSEQAEVDAFQEEVKQYEEVKVLERIEGTYKQEPVAPLRNIIVVGCGGTGSWLIPKLAKTINDMKRKNLLASNFKLFLVDGDTVEEKNLIRQNFVESDIGKNKAEIMAMRYGPTMPDIEVNYIDKYLTYKNKFDINYYVKATSLPHNGRTIIFNLVDNHNARRAVHSIPINGWVVDIGNELVHGQLFATSYGNGDMDKLSFFTMSPETIETEEEVKIFSCAEADVDEALEEQFLVANDTAAMVGHNWLCSLMSGPDTVPARINFSCIPMPTVSVVLKTVRF